MNAPTERVLGIGGLFFRSRDPQQLAQWYQLHLGVDPVPTDYNHQVWQRAKSNSNRPLSGQKIKLSDRDSGRDRELFVRSLDAMVTQLRKANIEVKVDPEKYPNGRFARLHDPEGNPIKLWEPASPA